MPDPRYPVWLRDALYSRAIASNILPPQGVYRQPVMRAAPFYTPYGVQFVWDLPYSAYTAARVGGDVSRARGFVENMLDFVEDKGPDAGMVLRSATWDGDQAGQVGTQTPLLSWLSWQLHTMEPDEEFLGRVYPPLAAFIDWWQSPRRDVDGDGLSEYGGTTPTYVAYESGHDYSPERDLVMGEPTAPGADGLVHEPIADVFLNASLYAELDALAAIAAVLGDGRASEWTERRDALQARMRAVMWDEELGGFYPVIRRDLNPDQPRVYRQTPALLQPLWAGLADEREAARTVTRLLETPRDYPQTDGEMTIRLSPALYHGYQVVTDALHPTAGTGPAAGGVELTADGLVCRFGYDRGATRAAFTRLTFEAVVAEAGDDAHVEVAIVDGQGNERTPVSGQPGGDGRIEGVIGRDPFLNVEVGGWLPGLQEIAVAVTDCRLTELRVGYARMDRTGLMSRFGLKSAHPLDGKHPAPGAPTEFWSGTVWGPHSFHACQALRRYGYDDLARVLAQAYCDGAVSSFLSTGDTMEHHDPETGRGYGTGSYTWGAGVALVLMNEFLDP